MSRELYESANRLQFKYAVQSSTDARDTAEILVRYLYDNNADDDEPVTEDWLYTIAKPSPLSVAVYGFFKDVGSVVVHVEPSYPPNIKWHVIVTDGRDVIRLGVFETRGRLRRLLKVLGDQ